MVRRSWLLSSLMACSALASVQASAQDVVMRRPLPSTLSPSDPNSTPTVTPTPSTPTPSTPTPSTPTPTPTPSTPQNCDSLGNCTPAPTPTPTPTPTPGSPSDPDCLPGSGCITPPGPVLGTVAYGYAPDCLANSSSCMRVDYTGPSQTSQVDYSKMQYTPTASCPTSQSADADALALSAGLIPVGSAGTNQGMDFCDPTKNPAGNVSTYIAGSYCSGGQTQVYCSRVVFAAPFVAGTSQPLSYISMPVSACAAQPKDAIWNDLQARGYGSLDPDAVLSTQGKACKDQRSYTIDGARCTYPTNSGDPQFQCTSLYVYDDGTGNVTVNPNKVSSANCMNDENLDADQKAVLASYGYLPAGPNIAQTCSSQGLYGANRICKTSVTYDPGWPQSGQAHVNTDPTTACYAIFGKDDPKTLTLQAAPESACASNLPSDADRAFLRTLEPDVYPYDEIPTQCVTIQGAPYNYQRDTVAHNVSVGSVEQVNGPSCNGSVSKRATVTYTVPYVCTDSQPGDYYGGIQTGLGSSYPMNRGTCAADHAADTQNINQNGINVDTGDTSSLFQCDGYSATGGFMGGTPDSVVDAPDQSQYKVTSTLSCFNPIC